MKNKKKPDQSDQSDQTEKPVDMYGDYKGKDMTTADPTSKNLAENDDSVNVWNQNVDRNGEYHMSTYDDPVDTTQVLAPKFGDGFKDSHVQPSHDSGIQSSNVDYIVTSTTSTQKKVTKSKTDGDLEDLRERLPTPPLKDESYRTHAGFSEDSNATGFNPNTGSNYHAAADAAATAFIGSERKKAPNEGYETSNIPGAFNTKHSNEYDSYQPEAYHGKEKKTGVKEAGKNYSTTMPVGGATLDSGRRSSLGSGSANYQRRAPPVVTTSASKSAAYEETPNIKTDIYAREGASADKGASYGQDAGFKSENYAGVGYSSGGRDTTYEETPHIKTDIYAKNTSLETNTRAGANANTASNEQQTSSGMSNLANLDTTYEQIPKNGFVESSGGASRHAKPVSIANMANLDSTYKESDRVHGSKPDAAVGSQVKTHRDHPHNPFATESNTSYNYGSGTGATSTGLGTSEIKKSVSDGSSAQQGSMKSAPGAVEIGDEESNEVSKKRRSFSSSIPGLKKFSGKSTTHHESTPSKSGKGVNEEEGSHNGGFLDSVMGAVGSVVGRTNSHSSSSQSKDTRFEHNSSKHNAEKSVPNKLEEPTAAHNKPSVRPAVHDRPVTDNYRSVDMSDKHATHLNTNKETVESGQHGHTLKSDQYASDVVNMPSLIDPTVTTYGAVEEHEKNGSTRPIATDEQAIGSERRGNYTTLDPTGNHVRNTSISGEAEKHNKHDTVGGENVQHQAGHSMLKSEMQYDYDPRVATPRSAHVQDNDTSAGPEKETLVDKVTKTFKSTVI